MNYILQEEKENILYSIVMLPSLRIVLKRIMSLCSAVVVLFYCCMKTLQYKKLSFLLLDIWVAFNFFFFLMLYGTICTFLYMSPGVHRSFSKVYPGVSHRLCISSTLAKNGKLFFRQTVWFILPSLANTVRPPPHQSAPIWLPVIVSLRGFSFLISWWWVTLRPFHVFVGLLDFDCLGLLSLL